MELLGVWEKSLYGAESKSLRWPVWTSRRGQAPMHMALN